MSDRYITMEEYERSNKAQAARITALDAELAAYRFLLDAIGFMNLDYDNALGEDQFLAIAEHVKARMTSIVEAEARGRKEAIQAALNFYDCGEYCWNNNVAAILALIQKETQPVPPTARRSTDTVEMKPKETS